MNTLNVVKNNSYCQFEKEQLTNLQHQTDKVTAAINKRLLKRNLLANTTGYSTAKALSATNDYRPRPPHICRSLA